MTPKTNKEARVPDFLSVKASNSNASLLTFHAKYTVMYVHKTITNIQIQFHPLATPKPSSNLSQIIVAIIAKVNGSNINTKISIPKHSSFYNTNIALIS